MRLVSRESKFDLDLETLIIIKISFIITFALHGISVWNKADYTTPNLFIKNTAAKQKSCLKLTIFIYVEYGTRSNILMMEKRCL